MSTMTSRRERDPTRSWPTGLSVLLVVLLFNVSAAHDETREAGERRRQHVERAALALADPTVTTLADEATAEVVLKIVDDATGHPLPALVRITNVGDGLAIRLPNEIHRAANWFSLAAETTLRLPRRKLRIEAVQGLDSELAACEVDLSKDVSPLTPGSSPARGEGRAATAVELRLRRIAIDGADATWAGNTHLHLRGLSIAEMDRYLRLVPQTDGLDVVFVSHLRRAVDDRDYTSNVLTTADLARLSTPDVQFGNGEEHRHNFGPGGEGYGHVMFLNIKQLIQPVSIGPGIMKEGTDGLPLRAGIDAARADGATVIWCHNRFGLEDVPNWLTERLDAQNIHDGSQVHGSYDETYYRYLNLGLRVPFSTGTDWFVYDFSRVYVPRRTETTAAAWLGELAAGRTFITNGPLLDFQLGEHAVGETIRINRPATLRARGRAVGRSDFGGLELVCDGQVVARAKTQATERHFAATLDEDVKIEGPGWYALRIPLEQGKNELDQPLFAHTSPIYVEFAGRRVFHAAVAETLLIELRRALEVIPQQGRFADDAERERVLQVYRDALRMLEARIGDGR
jgi:hypothetical protein